MSHAGGRCSISVIISGPTKALGTIVQPTNSPLKNFHRIMMNYSPGEPVLGWCERNMRSFQQSVYSQ